MTVKKSLWKLIHPFLLLVLTLAVLIPLFTKQLLYTDDGELHAARIANYYLAFKQGQILPRLAPNLDSGYGSPVFNFVYPLPYIIGTLIYMILPATIVFSLNLTVILLTIIGVSGAYYLARQFLDQQQAALTALIYLSTPYTLINIFSRTALGEIAFFAIIPWVMWSAENFIRYKKVTLFNQLAFIFALTLLVLSHQTSIITTLPILIGYYLLRINNQKKFITLIKQLIPIPITALLLTTWYWLPALWEKQYVILDRADTITNYLTQFPTTWSFFFQKVKNLDRFGTYKIVTLGYSSWIIFLSGLTLIKTKNAANKKIIIYLLSAISFTIILMMPFTRPLWIRSGLGNYVQYPWRLLSVVTMSSLLLLIHLLQTKQFNKNYWLSGALIIAGGLSIMTYAQPRGFQDWSDYELFEYFKTTTTFNEFQTIWSAKYTRQYPPDKISFRAPDQKLYEDNMMQAAEFTQLETKSWQGSKMVYQVETDQPVEVIQKTYFFPGWELYVDHKKQLINYQDEEFPGHIIYHLEPGKHQINTKFTQHTPARKIGLIALFIGIISILVMLL